MTPLSTTKQRCVSPRINHLLEIAFFASLVLLQLLCAWATDHYGQGIRPGILAWVAFYLPTCVALIAKRSSWFDVLAVGLILLVMAAAVDHWAFPLGTFALISLHLFVAIGVFLSSALTALTK